MKRELAVVAACAGLLAHGVPVTVESDWGAETLGMAKTAKSSFTNEVVLAIPFVKSPSGGTNTVDTLLVAGFGEDDSIRVWNPNEASGVEYDTWIDWWGDGTWVPAAKTKGGTTPGPAAETEVARGNAFWFKDSSKSSVDLVQAGLVRTGAVTRVAAGSSAKEKMTLLASPYGEAFDVGGKVTAVAGAAAGDQIALIDGDMRYEYGYDEAADRNGWGTWQKGEVVMEIGSIKIYGPDKFVALSSFVVPAGKAFWYISKGGAPTVAWD